jgi:hypothetical protein
MINYDDWAMQIFVFIAVMVFMISSVYADSNHELYVGTGVRVTNDQSYKNEFGNDRRTVDGHISYSYHVSKRFSADLTHVSILDTWDKDRGFNYAGVSYGGYLDRFGQADLGISVGVGFVDKAQVQNRRENPVGKIETYARIGKIRLRFTSFRSFSGAFETGTSFVEYVKQVK